MITVVRRYFKSGSKLVLWLIMGAFVVGLMPAAFRQMSQSGQWAIRVNGQDIGYRDFIHETNKQKQQIMAFRRQYGEYADWLLSTMGMSDPKSMAYRVMVKEELINQFGGQLGIHLNPAYVINQMNNPQFVQEELGNVMPPQIVDKLGGINHQLLRQYLQYTGLSSEMFERQIERALMDGIVRDLVGASLYVPEFDIKQKYATDHAKKNFSLFTLSKKDMRALARKQPVSPQELEQFFEDQNKQFKRYWVPEKRSGTAWTFDPKKYHIVISDNEIESYYDKNKQQEFLEQPAMIQVRRILFKVPNEQARASVQDRIGRLRDEILPDPSKFAEFAKQQSEDKESAANGGLLEPFTRESHEPIFDKTAFLMKKDGEVSSVIETKDGYEMLQRVSKTPQSYKPLSLVKKDIKDLLSNKKFDTLFERDIQKITESQTEHNDDALLAFIKEKGATSKQIKDLVRDNSMLAEHLFKLDQNGTDFFIEDNKGVIVKLTDVQESYLPAFESIKSVVQADYYDQKAKNLLTQKIKEAQEALTTNKSFEELQKMAHGTLVQTGWLQANKPEQAESLKEQGVPVDKMLQLEMPNSTLTHISDEHGYLIRLDEVSPLDEEEYKRERAEFANSFINDRMKQYLEGFVASLHKNATIETNELLVTIQD